MHTGLYNKALLENEGIFNANTIKEICRKDNLTTLMPQQRVIIEYQGKRDMGLDIGCFHQ